MNKNSHKIIQTHNDSCNSIRTPFAVWYVILPFHEMSYAYLANCVVERITIIYRFDVDRQNKYIQTDTNPNTRQMSIIFTVNRFAVQIVGCIWSTHLKFLMGHAIWCTHNQTCVHNNEDSSISTGANNFRWIWTEIICKNQLKYFFWMKDLFLLSIFFLVNTWYKKTSVQFLVKENLIHINCRTWSL